MNNSPVPKFANGVRVTAFINGRHNDEIVTGVVVGFFGGVLGLGRNYIIDTGKELSDAYPYPCCTCFESWIDLSS